MFHRQAVKKGSNLRLKCARIRLASGWRPGSVRTRWVSLSAPHFPSGSLAAMWGLLLREAGGGEGREGERRETGGSFSFISISSSSLLSPPVPNKVRGLGSAVSSPSESWRSTAARHNLVHFRVKSGLCRRVFAMCGHFRTIINVYSIVLAVVNCAAAEAYFTCCTLQIQLSTLDLWFVLHPSPRPKKNYWSVPYTNDFVGL